MMPTCVLLRYWLQLTKLDTLAGLAVKYNVTVGLGAKPGRGALMDDSTCSGT